MRNLILVLGDQLDERSAAFDGFDHQQDRVWMAEVAAEANHVWSHQARIALFLSAMRHYRDRLVDQGVQVDYQRLEDADSEQSFGDALRSAVERLRPQKLILVEPGEWRVKQEFETIAAEQGWELEVRPDRHFLCSREEFARHAQGRKQLRLEYFYRELRRKHGVLMEQGDPVGGKWNYDSDNRGTFSKQGPGQLPEPNHFEPDPITLEVFELVKKKFPQHPGSLTEFDWPVTREQAVQALDDFVQFRLPHFGEFQDAMWTDQPYLYHSRLSTALNLKLIDPREAIRAAEDAYESNKAPLNAVEGFIRQILGWREYVRGIYWSYMPDYLERNELQAQASLPVWFWTGETDMNCLRQTLGQTLKFGYAHHIQRLMVTGLFSLLLGVDPKEVHQWYLAVYVDAIEWVELPNSLGMSQFADGGVMASKPYVATGKYIQRMSNYCQGCGFDPGQATGDLACPFTTLYWDFLARHEAPLLKNPRMSLQVRNLQRKSGVEVESIRARARQLRRELGSDPVHQRDDDA